MDRPAVVFGKTKMLLVCHRKILSFIFAIAVMGNVPNAIADSPSPSCPSLGSQDVLAQGSLPQGKGSKESRSDRYPPPSLWWAKEQFDPFDGRLIENWTTDGNRQQIDLIVNSQLWSSLDYLDRYQFVTHFGAIARESHYNLRIINAQNKCLAIYSCQFDTIPYQCELLLETREHTGLRLDPKRYDNSN